MLRHDNLTPVLIFVLGKNHFYLKGNNLKPMYSHGWLTDMSDVGQRGQVLIIRLI